MGYAKLWDNILDNPKVQRLQPTLFKAWVNMLAVATRRGLPGGELPPTEDLAFLLRVNPRATHEWLIALSRAGLIDEKDGRYFLHDFDIWNSAKDKTGSDRQAAWRARNALRNGKHNALVTPPYELKNEGRKDPPLPPPGGKRGDGGGIPQTGNPEPKRGTPEHVEWLRGELERRVKQVEEEAKRC